MVLEFIIGSLGIGHFKVCRRGATFFHFGGAEILLCILEVV